MTSTERPLGKPSLLLLGVIVGFILYWPGLDRLSEEPAEEKEQGAVQEPASAPQGVDPALLQVAFNRGVVYGAEAYKKLYAQNPTVQITYVSILEEAYKLAIEAVERAHAEEQAGAAE